MIAEACGIGCNTRETQHKRGGEEREEEQIATSS